MEEDDGSQEGAGLGGRPRTPSTRQRPLVPADRAGRRPGAQGPRREGGPGCPWKQTPLQYLVTVLAVLIPLTSSVSTTQMTVLFKRTGCVNAGFSALGTHCRHQSVVSLRLPLCPRAWVSLRLCVSLCFPPFPPPSVLLIGILWRSNHLIPFTLSEVLKYFPRNKE